jgi:hypothetical protein
MVGSLDEKYVTPALSRSEKMMLYWKEEAKAYVPELQDSGMKTSGLNGR